MAMADRIGWKMRQVRGKGNDTMGALKGDTSQQIKGKVQKAVGKMQDAVGKADNKAQRKARNPD